MTRSAWVLLFMANAAACTGGGGGGGGDECSEAADGCVGESICIDGRCEAAFGRVYTLMDVAVSMPTTDTRGDAWDAFGGAPDLFARISVDGSTIATTGVIPDSFSGNFRGPYNTTLIAGSSLVVEVFDEDISANDLMFTCTASPITPNILRGRSARCATSGASVAFQIDPR